MENKDIRRMVFEAGITYRKIAAAMEISPQYLCDILRKELSPVNRIRVLEAIAKVMDNQ